MPTSRPRRPVEVGITGGVAVTAGLALVVFGIVRARSWGGALAGTVVPLAAAAVLLVGFILIEANRRATAGPAAHLPYPEPGCGEPAPAAARGAWIPMWFLLNLYLQQVLYYDAFAGGAALLPMTRRDHGADGRSRPAGDGPVRFQVADCRLPAGCCCSAVALYGLSFAGPEGSFAVDVLGPSLVAAAGMVLAFIPSLSAAISSVRPEEGGLASGIRQHLLPGRPALGLAR